MNEASELVWQGKGWPVRLAANRCQTGTSVFNVSSATSFLNTQTALTGAVQQTAVSYFTSASQRPTFCLEVGSQNEQTKKTKTPKNEMSSYVLVNLIEEL
ncbi:hypothetical protein ILYODFUR_031385 [Ilyodon furcidens]|uniref:Uncharacterized protein n=1 Tax=Ilyodon furcidens TaxID=33524 RepID=A0ABV0UWS2_9TELE